MSNNSNNKGSENKEDLVVAIYSNNDPGKLLNVIVGGFLETYKSLKHKKDYSAQDLIILTPYYALYYG